MPAKTSIALGCVLVCGLACLFVDRSRRSKLPVRYVSSVKLLQRYLIHALPAQVMYRDWNSKEDFDRDFAEFRDTEMESLISFEILQRVAEALGPERIQDGLSPSDVDGAAGEIRDDLKVNRVSPFVIEIHFEHSSRDMPQLVLSKIVEENVRIRKQDAIRRERLELEIMRGEKAATRPKSVHEAIIRHCNPSLSVLGNPSEPAVADRMIR